MLTQAPEIKQKLKELGQTFGLDDEKASLLAEKCYEMAPWRPYGGAKSFSEIEQIQSAQEYSGKISEKTYQLESIVSNIVNDDQVESADERAEAIKIAADEYRDRVNALKPEQQKSILDSIKELIFGKKTSVEETKSVEMPTAGGFKIYRDAQGDYRWLSFSSNAFEDLDHELFTTKALEEAISHADKTGERGPLLVYHVPSAEIGQCDFQALEGRFLVESGTFDDTPLGKKALEHFINSDEERQVSIGYQYHTGDELDGQYDWTRIVERSVTPYGAAANPWTSFKVIGENPMDANKEADLKKIFGDELAGTVIATASAKTKELEKTTRFKELKPEVATSLKNFDVMVKSLPDGDVKTQLAANYDVLVKAMKYEEDDKDEDKDDKKADKKEVEVVATPAVTTDSATPTEAATPVIGVEQVTQLATLIAGLTEELGSVKTLVASVQSEVKELKLSDDEKIANAVTPKVAQWNGFGRPSDSKDNVIDSEAMKSIFGTEQTTAEDPAKKYVDDLLGHKVGA